MDLVDELASYLGTDRATAQMKAYQGCSNLAAEWRRMNPQTPKDIWLFYCQAENYIFDLAQWHMSDGLKQQTQRIVDFCRQQKLRRLLDYGCGIGEDGIALAEAGFEVTLADVPGKTLQFARWRVQQRGLQVHFIEIWDGDDSPLQETYDGIICLEVLEHLWNPPAILKHFHHHLTPGGCLLVTATFVHSESHPMHLVKNQQYQGERFFQLMKDIGFEFLQEAGLWPMVFRKQGEDEATI